MACNRSIRPRADKLKTKFDFTALSQHFISRFLSPGTPNNADPGITVVDIAAADNKEFM